MSRIEFSLLVRPSTTVPVSQVAPWENELSPPVPEGHPLNPYETNCGLWIWAIQIKFDWLIDLINPAVPDYAMQPAKFFSVHQMSRTMESEESRGGGGCLMVNSSWCDSASIAPLTCSCTLNLELGQLMDNTVNKTTIRTFEKSEAVDG